MSSSPTPPSRIRRWQRSATVNATAEVATVRCRSSAHDALTLREANFNRLMNAPFKLLESEAILSTSSISLIISAPRSTDVKPTLVRDSSATVSSGRRSAAEAALVLISVSVSAPHPAPVVFSYRERVIARSPSPPQSRYPVGLYVRRPR
jgi:hypothetical protein